MASPEWQGTAASLVAQAGFNPITAGHAYPLLGVAQYLEVQRAEAATLGTDAESNAAPGDGIGTGGRARLETDRGAVAGASAVVLTYLFPSQAQMLEGMVPHRQMRARASLIPPSQRVRRSVVRSARRS